MFRRILVPLDGSHLAEQVLPLAELMARACNARLELLRAVENLPPEWMDWMLGSQPTQIAAGISDRAQEYVDKIAEDLSPKGFEVIPTIHAGYAADVITETAALEPETLIALASHGRSGINRWILGSTAEKVLQMGNEPLLMVKTNPEQETAEPVSLEQIIVPLDGSEVAEQVLPYASYLSRALELKIVLVRVALPTEDLYHSLGYSAAPNADFTRDIDTQTENYFNQLLDGLRNQGLTKVENKILHGHPAEEIVKLGNDTPNSLVAMTSHGRSGIGRWALGSVTDRVIKKLDAPILLVRASHPRE